MRIRAMREKIIRTGQFFTYILQCKNGTYYTGYTNNLEKRITLHNSGRGAKYTRDRRPVKLVYAKQYTYYKCALNAERKIKTLAKKQKQRLVDSYKRCSNNRTGIMRGMRRHGNTLGRKHARKIQSAH